MTRVAPSPEARSADGAEAYLAAVSGVESRGSGAGPGWTVDSAVIWRRSGVI
jgi:hypothetical protein